VLKCDFDIIINKITSTPCHKEASAATGYDALLKDGVYWPASVLSEVLNLTVVDVLSMGPAQPLLGQPWSTPNPVAYLPQLGSGLTPNMGGELLATLCRSCCDVHSRQLPKQANLSCGYQHYLSMD